ncbi:hypothetical protein ABIF34_007948 [Bradyrhizobium japonicum]
MRKDTPSACSSRLVDRLGGFQDLLGRLLGAADDRAEFAIDLGHLAAVEALAVQRRNFALGAVDGVVDEVELDLQLLALLDLRPVGVEHGARLGKLMGRGSVDRRHRRAGGQRGSGALRHLCADRAQLRHDLAMHRRSLLNHFGAGHLADNSLFDTKTFAVNSHQKLPPPHSRVFVGRSNLTRGSRPELLRGRARRREKKRLTMSMRLSSKINADRQIGLSLATW